MIDHLIRYASEEEAFNDPNVESFHFDGVWDTSRVIPGVRVYRVTGFDLDEEGNEFEVVEYLPYWYLWVALPDLNENLADISMVVANRETGEVIKSLIPQEDWPDYHCTPVIAGSHYPFGV